MQSSLATQGSAVLPRELDRPPAKAEGDVQACEPELESGGQKEQSRGHPPYGAWVEVNLGKPEVLSQTLPSITKTKENVIK